MNQKVNDNKIRAAYAYSVTPHKATEILLGAVAKEAGTSASKLRLAKDLELRAWRYATILFLFEMGVEAKTIANIFKVSNVAIYNLNRKRVDTYKFQLNEVRRIHEQSDYTPILPKCR